MALNEVAVHARCGVTSVAPCSGLASNVLTEGTMATPHGSGVEQPPHSALRCGLLSDASSTECGSRVVSPRYYTPGSDGVFSMQFGLGTPTIVPLKFCRMKAFLEADRFRPKMLAQAGCLFPPKPGLSS